MPRHRIRPELMDLAFPIADLRPHPDNPWNGDDEELSLSLTRFGQYRPVEYQASSGRVLRGNTTYAAALGLGWDLIAAVDLDVDDDQALAIMLADNRAKDGGGYDTSKLLTLLERAGDLTGTGYPPDATALLLSRPGVVPAGVLAGPADPVAASRQSASPLPPLPSLPDLPFTDASHDLRQTVLLYDRPTFEHLADVLDALQGPEETWTDVVTRVVLAAGEE